MIPSSPAVAFPCMESLSKVSDLNRRGRRHGKRAPDLAMTVEDGSGLSDRQIVQAAREIITEVGVDGLTMRALSARLGVALGATYHYVPTKRDLMLLVAHELYDEVILPERGTWDQRLKKLMISVAEVVGRYPGMAAFLNANAADAMPVDLRRRVFSLLQDAGFNKRNNDAIRGALFIFVNGVNSGTIKGGMPAGLGPADVKRMFQDGLDILLAGARVILDEQRRFRRGS
jgi:AcrR family transcriptional regulator